MANCNLVTDKAFKYIQDTNKAIKYLTNIHTLNIICCDLITDDLSRIPIVIKQE